MGFFDKIFKKEEQHKSNNIDLSNNCQIRDFFNSFDCIYVMFNLSTGERIPSIPGAINKVWAFTEEKYANLVKMNNIGIDLDYKKLYKNEFDSFFRTLCKIGINTVELNAMTQDNNVLINVEQLLAPNQQYYFLNTRLNLTGIKFKQNYSINNEQIKAYGVQMFKEMLNTLPSALFFCPIKGSDYECNTLYFTNDSYKVFIDQKLQLENQLSMFMSNEFDCIPGGSKYLKKIIDETVKLLSIIDEGDELIVSCTDVEEIKEYCASDVAIGVFTIFELYEIMNKNNVQGIALNPAFTNIVLEKKTIASVVQR